MFGIACSPRCVKWCSQCWLITNGKLCRAAEIIFPRRCVPDMFVTSYSVTYCLYIPEKPGFFFIIVQFMVSANSRIRFGLQIMFVCLYITASHYHHCANLSEDIENASQIYFVECVSKIKHIFCYPLYNTWGVSVYPFPLCPMWWLRG